MSGDRNLAADLGGVALVGVAVLVAADHPAVMWAAVLAGTMLASALRRDGAAGVAFLGVCAVLGASNDWNSVTNHRIYDYTVALEAPALSLVPLWMLAFWGLVLRTTADLYSWDRLALGTPTLGPVGVGVLIALVLATRQAIYVWFLDPVWSWAPFAAALAVAAMLGLGARRWLVALAVGVIGTAVEAVFIRSGGLHAYHLGVFGGVPVWISLWWVLGGLAWSEVAPRLARGVADPGHE